MKRYLLICVVLLACGAWAIYFLLAPPGVPKVAAAAASTPSAIRSPRAAAPISELARKAPAPVSPLGDDVPAWARGKETAGKAPVAPGSDRVGAARHGMSPEVKAAAERLAALQLKKDVTPKEVAAALGDFEKANGSSVVGGVHLDVLRQNLLVADEMKTVGDELQAMQEAGALQTAAGRAKVQEKLKQLEEIRGRMQTDFGVTPASALAAGKTGPAP